MSNSIEQIARVVCEHCGVLTTVGGSPSHRRGVHHMSHAIINKRVRDGWVPVHFDILAAWKSIDEEYEQSIEREGIHAVMNEYGRTEYVPTFYTRVDSLLEIQEQCCPKGGHLWSLARRTLEAATLCRQGVPWWQAWVMASGPMNQESFVFKGELLTINRVQPPKRIQEYKCHRGSPFMISRAP